MKAQKKQIVVYISEDVGLPALMVLDQIRAKYQVIATNFKNKRVYAVEITYDSTDVESAKLIESLEWPSEPLDNYLDRHGLLYHKETCLECNKPFQSKRKKRLYCSAGCKYQYVIKQMMKMRNKSDDK